MTKHWIGEGTLKTCVPGIHVRPLHDRVVKEGSGALSPKSDEQAEPTERHTACSTLGCRCAFHGSSLSVQRDLHSELQLTRRLILRSVVRTSFKFAPEDTPRIFNACRSSSASECTWPPTSRDALDRTRAGITLSHQRTQETASNSMFNVAWSLEKP